MSQEKRVLQIANLNRNSGVAGLIMSLYRNIDRKMVQFDFVFWSFEPENYIEEIEHLGGTVYKVPCFKKNYLEFKRQIRAILDTGYYDTVHCHEFLLSLPILLWAKKKHIAVRIAHSHNPSIESFLKRGMVAVFRPFFKKWSTCLFACSEASGRFLFGKKVDFYVVKNGLDLKSFIYSEEERNKLRVSFKLEDKFVIGNIGRLSYQKNHSYLLDIFAQIYKKDKTAVLVIVGEGELREELKHKAEEIGIKTTVYFMGARTDVPGLLELMDVFVFPSNYEGLGIALMEAQCMGLPCIASDKVPKESRITEDFQYISLKMPPEYWAEKILFYKGYERKGQPEAVLASGYDIRESAKKLEMFYLTGNY